MVPSLEDIGGIANTLPVETTPAGSVSTEGVVNDALGASPQEAEISKETQINSRKKQLFERSTSMGVREAMKSIKPETIPAGNDVVRALYVMQEGLKELKPGQQITLNENEIFLVSSEGGKAKPPKNLTGAIEEGMSDRVIEIGKLADGNSYELTIMKDGKAEILTCTTAELIDIQLASVLTEKKYSDNMDAVKTDLESYGIDKTATELIMIRYQYIVGEMSDVSQIDEEIFTNALNTYGVITDSALNEQINNSKVSAKQKDEALQLLSGNTIPSGEKIIEIFKLIDPKYGTQIKHNEELAELIDDSQASATSSEFGKTMIQLISSENNSKKVEAAQSIIEHVIKRKEEKINADESLTDEERKQKIASLNEKKSKINLQSIGEWGGSIAMAIVMLLLNALMEELHKVDKN